MHISSCINERGERTHSGRASIPDPHVAIDSNVVVALLRNDSVTEHLVELDLVAADGAEVARAQFADAGAAVRDEDASRPVGRVVVASDGRVGDPREVRERVPVDLVDGLSGDTSARESRVVVGADDDGTPLLEDVSVPLPLRSLLGPLERALAVEANLSRLEGAASVRLGVLSSGEGSALAVRGSSDGSLVDEGGGGGRGDVAVGWDTHEDLVGGHAGGGPGCDTGCLVGVGLVRVGAGVGEGSVGTGSGRGYRVPVSTELEGKEARGRTTPDIVVHNEDVVQDGGESADVGERTSVGADEGSLGHTGGDPSVGSEGLTEEVEEDEEVGSVVGRLSVSRVARRSGVFPD
jgi:hypothetical protein